VNESLEYTVSTGGRNWGTWVSCCRYVSRRPAESSKFEEGDGHEEQTTG